MDTQEIKLDLIQWLATLKDVKILQQIAYLKEQQADKGSEYLVPGKPMAEEELMGRIQAARQRIEDGQFTTMDNLEKEMQEW
jgi:hypothetical protein